MHPRTREVRAPDSGIDPRGSGSGQPPLLQGFLKHRKTATPNVSPSEAAAPEAAAAEPAKAKAASAARKASGATKPAAAPKRAAAANPKAAAKPRKSGSKT
jgi:hypothetical protein